MFIGHFGAGFAGRAVEPKPSLGTWILAIQWLDLIWPFMLLTGLEHVRIAPGITAVTPLDFTDYPITHSLAAAVGWSILFGGVYFARRRNLVASALLGLGVLSHWVLDFIAHRPDLPLWPGGPKVGLDLWASVPATAIVETLIFAGGVWLYARATTPRDRTGRWAFWAMAAFLYAIYVANLTGPPPPSVPVLAYSALAVWLFVPWGYWIDRHRTAARPGAGPGL
jgi:hypothetical protein